MSNNSFGPAAMDSFLGTKVRVRGREHSYTGWAVRWQFDRLALLLYDAERDDGERFSDVIVNDPSSIERLDDQKHVEPVPVSEISPFRYDVREYGGVAFWQYARKFRERGHLVSYPIVRPLPDGGYETLGGHRRLASARAASIDTVPVLVEEVDDWEATKTFVYEHVPLPDERGKEKSGLYPPEKVEEAFELMLADWSLDRLAELTPLQPEVTARRETDE